MATAMSMAVMNAATRVNKPTIRSMPPKNSVKAADIAQPDRQVHVDDHMAEVVERA